MKDLTPQPLSPVLLDFPPFTRLITRGTALYDVFQDRSCDFALVFAQLLGLKDASFSSPNDFKALADQIPGVISGVRLSFE